MGDFKSYRELYNFVTEQDPNVLGKLMIFEKLLLMRCGFEWLPDEKQDQIVNKLHDAYTQIASEVEFDDFLYAVYELLDEDLKRRPEKILKLPQKKILDKVDSVSCAV